MRLSLLVAVSAMLWAAACGNEMTTTSSHLNQRNSGTGLQGEPDYKNKDGVDLMAWVKRPEARKAICAVLRELSKQGVSVVSQEAFSSVAKAFSLHPVEAEIVAVYALEMECPELN